MNHCSGASGGHPSRKPAHPIFPVMNLRDKFRNVFAKTAVVRTVAATGLFLLLAPSYLVAQTTNGPQAPQKPPEIIRIPTNPGASTDPSPIPPSEIIRRFAAKEDEFAAASRRYAARRSVRLDELGDDGKPDGTAEVTTTPVVTADGVRAQRPAGEPETTLQFLNLERDDLEILSKIPQFPLVTSELSKYLITYQGKQQVDELMTYAFNITPAQFEKGKVYFSGVVWVDDQELAVVKTYGKWVNDTGDVRLGNLPFTFFETYRQPVGNYWMPAYSRADSSIDNQGRNVPVRLVIRWDNYVAIPAGGDAPASPVPVPAPPASR